jgi:Papain family cysteine protease
MRNLKSNLKYVSMAAVGLALSLSSCQNDRSLTEDASNVTPKSGKSSKVNRLTSKNSGRVSNFGISSYLNELATLRPDLSEAQRTAQVTAGANVSLPRAWQLPSPTVGDQGTQGSCSGWAASYCGLSSLLFSFHPVIKAMPHSTNRELIDKWHAAARSYSFPYYYGKEDPKIDDGAYSASILNVLAQRGSVSLLARPGMRHDIAPTAEQETAALDYRLGHYRKFENSASSMKKDAKAMKYFLSKNYPILITLVAGKGMDELKDAGVGATLTNFEMDESKDSKDANHALCVVGYDNSKGFLIQNSWGTSWGENGRFWLKEEDIDFLGDMYVMFPKVN